MRVEYLSDHGGQQLRQAEEQLHHAQAGLASWHDADARASADLKSARRAKPLWKRLLFVATPEETAARARRAQARQQAFHAGQNVRQIDHVVRQRAAGVAGEDALAFELSSLSDEWVWLRGYRNRRGETDHVLVGPQGVWAIEVKLRRVRIHADGDEWWFEKLDRWGNVVDSGPATDRGGRSWARQVTDVAGDLAAWLGRNGQAVPVRTAVMLMHEQAQIGRCDNLGVDVVATETGYLLREMWQRASPLSPDDRASIVALIQRDHRFHQGRRRRR
ncbi:nuclease-related domain-containing protein [Polymorphospora sp. NPDC050346]|uniref:nuclease-related domain-containing protein n=1 Tax=Polymorphospora sp. NPDC050346 TaxID=3155780 RepID=UPI0033F28130